MTVFPPLPSLPFPAALPPMPLAGWNADFLAALAAVEVAAPEDVPEAAGLPATSVKGKEESAAPDSALGGVETPREEKSDKAAEDLPAIVAALVPPAPVAIAIEVAAPTVERPKKVVEGAPSAETLATAPPAATVARLPREQIRQAAEAVEIEPPIPDVVEAAIPREEAPSPASNAPGRAPADTRRAPAVTAAVSVEPVLAPAGTPPAVTAAAAVVVTPVKAAAREAAFLKRLANCETEPLRLTRAPAGRPSVVEPRRPTAEPQAAAAAAVSVERAETPRPVEEEPAAAPPMSQRIFEPRHLLPEAQAAATAPVSVQVEEEPTAPPAPAVAPEPVRPVRSKTATATMPLAFGARLAPTPPVAKPASAPAAPKAKADEPIPPPAAAPNRESPEPPEPPARSRALRPAEDRGEVTDPSADDRTPRPEPLLAVPAPRESEPAAPEKPAAEVAGPRRVATPEPTPKTAAPVARDIRIEIAGPERRVEVRLVERGGAVDLAVRTPDERLAGDLREHLPTLSSRLEQTGFRADQWHAAEAGGAARRLEVAAAAESSAGQMKEHGQGGGRDQRDREERRPEPREARDESNAQKGASFEWLMQSLR